MKKSILFFCLIIPFSITNGQVTVEESTIADAIIEIDQTMLRIHFVDVGAGLGMLIQTPSNNKVALIDGGDGSNDELQRYVDYIKSFVPDTTEIDLGIVTHADSDHFRGMHWLYHFYDVNEFWYNGYISQELNLEQTWWLEFILRVKQNTLNANEYFILNDRFQEGELFTFDNQGTSETSDDIIFQFLHLDDNPSEHSPLTGRSISESKRRNNASTVFKIMYGETSFLITGDINGWHQSSSAEENIYSVEHELWQRHLQSGNDFNLQSTVLQSPHHGSEHSNSLIFLQAVDPDFIVIPAGNEHRHPHKEAYERMIQIVEEDEIFRTDNGEPVGENTEEPRGDDNVIFVVSESGIQTVYFVK